MKAASDEELEAALEEENAAMAAGGPPQQTAFVSNLFNMGLADVDDLPKASGRSSEHRASGRLNSIQLKEIRRNSVQGRRNSIQGKEGSPSAKGKMRRSNSAQDSTPERRPSLLRSPRSEFLGEPGTEEKESQSESSSSSSTSLLSEDLDDWLEDEHEDDEEHEVDQKARNVSLVRSRLAKSQLAKSQPRIQKTDSSLQTVPNSADFKVEPWEMSWVRLATQLVHYRNIRYQLTPGTMVKNKWRQREHHAEDRVEALQTDIYATRAEMARELKEAVHAATKQAVALERDKKILQGTCETLQVRRTELLELRRLLGKPQTIASAASASPTTRKPTSPRASAPATPPTTPPSSQAAERSMQSLPIQAGEQPSVLVEPGQATSRSDSRLVDLETYIKDMKSAEPGAQVVRSQIKM